MSRSRSEMTLWSLETVSRTSLLRRARTSTSSASLRTRTRLFPLSIQNSTASERSGWRRSPLRTSQ